jgi:diguanylate cyclase (GGDEF)-like protein
VETDYRSATDRRSGTTAVLDLDRYSHAVGDDVLRQVASLLRQVVEPVGHAGRLGGEEFVLLDADRASAEQICERLRQVIAGYPWSDLAD